MESPHTYATQVVHTASQWNLDFTWPRMNLAQATVIQAWLDSLRGQAGTFRYTPRARTRNALTGRVLAAAAYAYGNNVKLSGWAANAASGLSVGHFFQLGDQLLRVTAAPVNADANGQLLVEFEPMLRANYANGAAVNFANPSGLFRLTTSDTPAFDCDTDGYPTFPSIIAKEAI
ncbi:hypothetical protein SAMN05192583_0070 [Sphingomonas gellani]|uniref:Uncharacterized protein n=2 Tax=Sphingomonas gellani TaxID=1166340 RepID=A0A1H7Y5M9_9SPHN|nr:hypothetical protein SAMN05192583_0070 [Sphingomonas gellani]